MKNYVNKTTKLFATSAISLALGGAAQAAVWTGAGVGNEYSTAANWDDNSAPSSGSTQDINSAVTVDRTVDSTAGRTFISGGAVVNIGSGTHSDNTSGAGIRNFLGRGSDGTVNQSGGDYNIGHMLSIGGGGASGNGIYNLTGGTLNLSRGSDSIIDGSNPHGRPSLEVSDEENAGSGLFEISGGSLITRFAAGVGSTGTFSVVGSASTIDIGNLTNGSGDWLQQAGGTIKATVDLGGLTPIRINDLAASGSVLAEFKSGALLEMDFNVTPYPGSWTVLQAEGTDILDGGLALTGSTPAGWSFNVDNSGANGLLIATYVPEPSAFTLLSLSLGSLIMLRRRAK
ncbi:MAG: hypothetical protein ACSHYF_04655 [Verrucomicrobiaceae bacterium]